MTEPSNEEGIERTINAQYDPLGTLGVLVPVNRTVRVGSHRVEIVATLADCTTTSIFYRAPREAMIWPQIVAPDETGGSSSGTMWRDLHVHHTGPVMPHRTSIAVQFSARDGADFPREPSETVVLPIDRSRTAEFERYAGAVEDVEVPGVRVRVLGASAGVLSTVLELLIEATDASVLMMDVEEHFGSRGFLRAGPGPAAFWREWVPESSRVEPIRETGPGGRVSVSMGSSFSLKARRLTTEEIARERAQREASNEPSVIREEPWAARSVPDGSELARQGARSGGGGRRSSNLTISFGVLSARSTGVELTLSGVKLYHFGTDQVARVQGPRADETVDLSGAAFEWRDGGVELKEWRSRIEGGWMTHRLVVAPSDRRWHPDIRLLHDDASVSLWMNEMSDGTCLGVLPAMYNNAFERDEVPLALRMVGVRSDPIRIAVPLPPARQAS